MNAGFIELKINDGEEEKSVEPKFEEYEIKCAAETLMKAKEIQADNELMPYVKDYMNKHSIAVGKVSKEIKSVKPKSIQDLRNAGNEMDSGCMEDMSSSED